jgi:MFS family permease
LPKSTEENDRLDPQIWKIVMVAVLGSLLAQLDATVVNVSLASLDQDLHTTLPVIQWVTSGCLLALALMLPLNGWLVERIGAKRLYLACFSGFTLASALCALSWSATSLIGFRVLQGITGGLMAPMAQLMLARVAGKHFVRVIGYAAVPVLLGPILGPVLAGAILQHTTWHWLFLINVPIGILAILLALLFLPRDDDTNGSTRELDLIGFLLLSPALVLFLYGIDHLGQQGGMVTLPLSGILLAAFIWKASKDRERVLIDLQLFRGRIFSASAITQFMTNGLAFAGQMLIPVCLVRALGESPSATGWLMAPSRSGDDMHLSMAGQTNSTFWYQRNIYRRRIDCASGHVNVSLFELASSQSVAASRCVVHKRGGHERGRCSIDFCRVCVSPPLGTADGHNLLEHCPASRRPNSDYTLRDVSRLAAGGCSLVRGPNRRFTISFALLCTLHGFLSLAAVRLPVSLEAVRRSIAADSALRLDSVAQ